MQLSLEMYWHIYWVTKAPKGDLDDVTAADILWDMHNLMICAGFHKETVQTAFEEILCELDHDLIISRKDICT